MSSNQSTRLQAIRQRLIVEANRIRSHSPEALFSSSDRLDQFSLQVQEIFFDFSLQWITPEILGLLTEYAEEVNLSQHLHQQFTGQVVNLSENRAALHTSIRGTQSEDPELDQENIDELTRCREFVKGVLSGAIGSYTGETYTEVVHVGIGGSYLGQRFLCDALEKKGIPVRFLTNLSGQLWQHTIRHLNPNRTLFIIASKSFSTPETIQNYQRVRSWLAETTVNPQSHIKNVVLVTADQTTLAKTDTTSFAMPQSVGGRFSLWSSMGLPIMLSAGVEAFDSLLQGAQAADQHVVTSQPVRNIGVLLALLEFWNVNFLGTRSHVVLSYVEPLRLLTAHLQQLEMESLGKSVDQSSHPSISHTGSVIWGGEETEGQHAWHQWLHQGTHPYSADVIGTTSDNQHHDRWILANCLAQQDLMFFGNSNEDEPHKQVPGCHGSNLILLDSTSPHTLGMLISLYEHKTACLGYLWQVNAFDQWGVEKGKVSANQILDLLHDSTTPGFQGARGERLRKIASHFEKLS